MSMKNRLYFVVGSLVIMYLGNKIYGSCRLEPLCQVKNGFMVHYNWFLYLPLIFLLVAILNFFLSGSLSWDEGSFFGEVFRKSTQEEIDELYKTFEPETQAEKRAWFNETERQLSSCSGSDSYIDYDGYKRNTTTEERMFMNRTDTGNGKSEKY